jgi:hypothetical protein
MINRMRQAWRQAALESKRAREASDQGDLTEFWKRVHACEDVVTQIM